MLTLLLIIPFALEFNAQPLSHHTLVLAPKAQACPPLEYTIFNLGAPHVLTRMFFLLEDHFFANENNGDDDRSCPPRN